MLPKVRAAVNDKVFYLERPPVKREEPARKVMAERAEAFRRGAMVILKDLFKAFPRD